MGLFDFMKKKKGLSAESANFAKLIKSYCMDSGIPIQLQLLVTKSIAKDFIDKKGGSINNFIFLEHGKAKEYLMKLGMTEMDCEIFLNIIQTNRDSFMAI